MDFREGLPPGFPELNRVKAHLQRRDHDQWLSHVPDVRSSTRSPSSSSSVPSSGFNWLSFLLGGSLFYAAGQGIKKTRLVDVVASYLNTGLHTEGERNEDELGPGGGEGAPDRVSKSVERIVREDRERVRVEMQEDLAMLKSGVKDAIEQSNNAMKYEVEFLKRQLDDLKTISQSMRDRQFDLHRQSSSSSSASEQFVRDEMLRMRQDLHSLRSEITECRSQISSLRDTVQRRDNETALQSVRSELDAMKSWMYAYRGAPSAQNAYYNLAPHHASVHSENPAAVRSEPYATEFVSPNPAVRDGIHKTESAFTPGEKAPLGIGAEKKKKLKKFDEDPSPAIPSVPASSIDDVLKGRVRPSGQIPTPTSTSAPSAEPAEFKSPSTDDVLSVGSPSNRADSMSDSLDLSLDPDSLPTLEQFMGMSVEPFGEKTWLERQVEREKQFMDAKPDDKDASTPQGEFERLMSEAEEKQGDLASDSVPKTSEDVAAARDFTTALQQTISSSSDPKWKNSQLMNFFGQISRGEISFQGNQVVQKGGQAPQSSAPSIEIVTEAVAPLAPQPTEASRRVIVGDSLRDRFLSYDFGSDVRFNNGVEKFKASPNYTTVSASATSWLTKLKVKYYKKYVEVIDDEDAFMREIDSLVTEDRAAENGVSESEDPSSAGVVADAPSVPQGIDIGVQPAAPLQQGNYSEQFISVLSMVQQGHQPPGIRQIDDKPKAGAKASLPNKKPLLKPWERKKLDKQANGVEAQVQLRTK
eukprot:ANDGO_08593.mRNA.1 hypothetical protein